MLRLGIDLGGTKIETIVLGPQGDELIRNRIQTPCGDYAATLSAVTQLIQQAESAVAQQCSIGICIPGTISPNSGLVKNANSTCLIGRPLDQDLERTLQRPIRIANDADCFTVSEAWDGAGKNSNVVFGVILGTGVGGGITAARQLLCGPNSITGEWGHNPLPWPTEDDLPLFQCYCGKQGCIETYLSGPALCRRYQLQQPQTVSDAQSLMKKVRQGDLHATHSFANYCTQLAKSLASVINVLDPDIIVLGGGLSNIPELYQTMPALLDSYVFSDQVNTPIRPALHGDSSGVRGAAWLWS
ncbi:MAG: ROK family protein [Motiliproteus sp.]